MILNAETIIENLRNEIFKNYLLQDTSIFLCGGARKDQAKFRFKLGKQIEQSKSKYSYSVYYPETIFTEILLGHDQTDLLSLENFLADSVNAVVIPLQSTGTFTELGAFANHKILKDKLIIIIDPKYKNHRSFINDGPIKYLRKSTKSIILYEDLERTVMKSLIYRITDASRKIKTLLPIKPSTDNPLVAKLFYMSLVYIFDPIDIDFFRTIVKKMVTNHDSYVEETIVQSILKERNISLLRNNQISFKEAGFHNYLLDKGINDSKINGLLKSLSEYRLQILNLYYRKKGVYYGGKVFTP